MRSDPDPWERIVELRRQRRPFCVCTVVDARGSSPRKRGAKMLVLPDGSQEGTIGGGAIEYEVHKEALAALSANESRLITRHLTHELGMCCGGGMSVFIEVQAYNPSLYLFGCGHTGVPIALLAARCGFDVVAIDGRAEYADPARFQGAEGSLEVVCEAPTDALDALPFDGEMTYVVVVTHDHDLDEAIVAEVLARPTRYLGCIGSARKGHKFRARLKARGFGEEVVARMRTPMGLDIHALTPDEIAVSVVGEMIAVRRGPGGPAGGG